MPLPPGIQTVTVLGTILQVSGEPVGRGSVTFSPATEVLYVGPNATTAPSNIVARLNEADGTFSIELPATDDPAGNPVNWTYAVREGFRGGRPRFFISLPYSPTSVRYEDIVPVPESEGEAIIRGPKGDPGPTGQGVLVLDSIAPVPPGTPAGTVVFRTAT